MNSSVFLCIGHSFLDVWLWFLKFGLDFYGWGLISIVWSGFLGLAQIFMHWLGFLWFLIFVHWLWFLCDFLDLYGSVMISIVLPWCLWFCPEFLGLTLFFLWTRLDFYVFVINFMNFTGFLMYWSWFFRDWPQFLKFGLDLYCFVWISRVGLGFHSLVLISVACSGFQGWPGFLQFGFDFYEFVQILKGWP